MSIARTHDDDQTIMTVRSPVMCSVGSWSRCCNITKSKVLRHPKVRVRVRVRVNVRVRVRVRVNFVHLAYAPCMHVVCFVCGRPAEILLTYGSDVSLHTGPKKTSHGLKLTRRKTNKDLYTYTGNMLHTYNAHIHQ